MSLPDQEERAHQPPEIRLGEDIVRGLAHYGDEAPEQVANHIQMFWDPRMRAALQARADAGEQMHPVLRDAVRQIAEPAG